MQPAHPLFRLSRINSPRSSMLSIVLLIVAFTCFGIWASANQIPTEPLQNHTLRTP